MCNEETADFISTAEVVIVATCDLKIELNTYCEGRHDYILDTMSNIVKREAFNAYSSEFHTLASLFLDREEVWNLDLVCALNLLAVHRVLDIVRQSDTAEVYTDEDVIRSINSIVESLKSSKYLSFSEFKKFSDKRNVEQLLDEINATENKTGLSMLCNGDIVVNLHPGYQT